MLSTLLLGIKIDDRALHDASGGHRLFEGALNQLPVLSINSNRFCVTHFPGKYRLTVCIKRNRAIGNGL